MKNRPNVLTIAGYDPCGGAGVLADIKTFEQCGVNGMGVITGVTYQTENSFLGVHWLTSDQIHAQLLPLLASYSFSAIKIGLVKDFVMLEHIVLTLKKHSTQIPIILDPILKATAGHIFHADMDSKRYMEILPSIYILTPNRNESENISGHKDGLEGAKHLAKETNIFLKGGHAQDDLGADFLFTKSGETIKFPPKETSVSPKHGSGCVLSAAITAYLAKGMTLEEACRNGKDYTYHFLASTNTLLGTHNRT